jgi:hypothetical protein
MVRFRFQLTGITEFGNDMTIPDVLEFLSKKLSNCEIVGSTIYRIDGKKRVRKKGL